MVRPGHASDKVCCGSEGEPTQSGWYTQ